MSNKLTPRSPITTWMRRLGIGLILVVALWLFVAVLSFGDRVVAFDGVVVDDITHMPLANVSYKDSSVIADVWPRLGRKPLDPAHMVDSTDTVGGPKTNSVGKFYHQEINHSTAVLWFFKPEYQPALVHLPVDTVYLTRR